MVIGHDPLGKSLQIGLIQQVPELRASNEDELKYQLLSGVDVREHPQLIDLLRLQVLSLVDDQNGLPACLILVYNELLQRMEPADTCRQIKLCLAKRIQNPPDEILIILR